MRFILDGSDMYIKLNKSFVYRRVTLGMVQTEN